MSETGYHSNSHGYTVYVVRVRCPYTGRHKMRARRMAKQRDDEQSYSYCTLSSTGANYMFNVRAA